MTAPTPTETPEKLRREIAIFFIVLGLLLGAGAYYALALISRHSPPLWGYPRYQAIDVALAALAALHLLPGILMLIFPGRLSCMAGAVASTLIAVVYVAFMCSVTRTFPLSLFSFAILVIPAVVWSRAAKFTRLKRRIPPRICEALLYDCPIHGLQHSVRTSKDLCEDAPAPRSQDDIVNLVYTIDGTPFFQFHLSSAFAAAHGLVAGVREGQDDDNLEWDRSLVRCCVKCFLQNNGGWFDQDSWWHPGQQPSGR